jgi:hypothetical protein
MGGAARQFKNEFIALLRRWEGPEGESDLESDTLVDLSVEALEEFLAADVEFTPDPQLLDELNDEPTEHQEGWDDL